MPRCLAKGLLRPGCWPQRKKGKRLTASQIRRGASWAILSRLSPWKWPCLLSHEISDQPLIYDMETKKRSRSYVLRAGQRARLRELDGDPELAFGQVKVCLPGSFRWQHGAVAEELLGARHTLVNSSPGCEPGQPGEQTNNFMVGSGYLHNYSNTTEYARACMKVPRITA